MNGDSFGDRLTDTYRKRPFDRGQEARSSRLDSGSGVSSRSTRSSSSAQSPAHAGGEGGTSGAHQNVSHQNRNALLYGTVAGALAGAFAAFVAMATGWAVLSGTAIIDSDGTAIRNDALASSDVIEAGADDRLLHVVRATRPAVVTIWNLQHARRSLTSPLRLEPITSGSGVIFDARGYVATNNHVIENARSIEVVFLDGRRAEAVVVRSERAYDIAILKLPEGIELPAVAPLADSSLLEPGMGVVAIGSPLGTEYQNSVTSGIIAGLNRNITTRSFDIFTWRTFEQDINATPLIQTDAAINSGNSGGPLIDFSGRVVGLNTAVLRRSKGDDFQGLGFAVPSNVVQALADEWIDGEHRASLGVGFRTIDPDFARISGMARGSGALVVEVPVGGAGARAGLLQDDRIVAIDGIPLDLDHALTDIMWRYRAGERVRLTVEREEEILELDVVLDTWSGGPG